MDATLYAASMAIGGGTHHFSDTIRDVIALRGMNNDPRVLRMILDKRAAWLNYLTVMQVKWQRNTKRQSRAKHHDSIAIRERYVRAY